MTTNYKPAPFEAHLMNNPNAAFAALIAHQASYSRRLATIYLCSLAGLMIICLVAQWSLVFSRYLRSVIFSLPGPREFEFRNSPRFWNWSKTEIFYAPLFRTRHRRPLLLGRRIHLGMLPTRLQAIAITTVLATNIFLCLYRIDWDKSHKPRLQLLIRTSTIAVSNLLPLTLIATVSNPLILLLGIPFDSFNIIHRWLGRLTIAETIVHITCVWIGFVENGGIRGIRYALGVHFIRCGLAAGCAFILILLLSPSFVRHRAYEVFLHCHIALVATALITLCWHLQNFRQRYFIYTALSFWIAARILRLETALYKSIGRNSCKALIDILPDDALRLQITCRRPWDPKAGQYIYLTIPSIGLWTAHPFSIAWTSESVPAQSANASPEGSPPTRPTITLLIRPQKGFTACLERQFTSDDPKSSQPVRTLLEGPYGPSPSMSHIDTAILIAGGIGITHVLSFIPPLLSAYRNGTPPIRQIVLVWTIRHHAELEWIRPFLEHYLQNPIRHCLSDEFDNIPQRKDVLRIQIFVTQPSSTEVIVPEGELLGLAPSRNTGVSTRTGRPEIGQVLKDEIREGAGRMAVVSCGPDGMMDDVRGCVRDVLREGHTVEFFEAGFGW